MYIQSTYVQRWPPGLGTWSEFVKIDPLRNPSFNHSNLIKSLRFSLITKFFLAGEVGQACGRQTYIDRDIFCEHQMALLVGKVVVSRDLIASGLRPNNI